MSTQVNWCWVVLRCFKFTLNIFTSLLARCFLCCWLNLNFPVADGFDRGEIPMIPRPCILLKCAMFAKQNKNDSDKAVNPKFRIAGVFEGRGGLGIVSVCEYVLHCFRVLPFHRPSQTWFGSCMSQHVVKDMTSQALSGCQDHSVVVDCRPAGSTDEALFASLSTCLSSRSCLLPDPFHYFLESNPK